MRGKQVKVNNVGSQRSTPNSTCKSNFKQNKVKDKGEAKTKGGIWDEAGHYVFCLLSAIKFPQNTNWKNIQRT